MLSAETARGPEAKEGEPGVAQLAATISQEIRQGLKERELQ